MASKTFLLLVLAFATVVLITSEVVLSKDLASNHVDTKAAGELEDAKYDPDDGRYDNGGGRGGYDDNGGGRGGRGRGYCRYGCCGGRRYDDRGCRCCSTHAEAAAYKQAHDVQTHD